jgi:hypothetical protein
MTETLCKLTDQDLKTYNGCQWALGEWKETSGNGDLCSPGWLHGYKHPLLAVLLNPIHATFDNPRLFRIEVAGLMKDDLGLKFGATEMRLVEEISLPAVTDEQRVRFAIFCALEVCKDAKFVAWANRWLSGEDQSSAAAESAQAAAQAAALAAESAAAESAWAAAALAAESAWAAAESAWAAALAAESAQAAWAAQAARAAAESAESAAGHGIDLISIARKAVDG